MTRRQYPLPPIEKFRHGAAWRVMLEVSAPNRTKKDWREAWEGAPKPEERLVLITAPWRTWPARDNYYWRSRLVVGDLFSRAPEDILSDFRTLLRQTPPVQRNWSNNLALGDYNKRTWHLVWLHEEALLV
jgi:hypothetical protein